jgi:hypothetical protein
MKICSNLPTKKREEPKSLTLDEMARPLSLAASTLESELASRPASFSWRELMQGQPPKPADLRRCG